MHLQKLSVEDGVEIYQMLQDIGAKENSFTNPVHGMNYKEFKEWLVRQDQWSRGENLPEGFVTESVFWLYDGVPVGIGKIRHELTEHSRRIGGNIGYAVSLKYRNHGYGKKLLSLLLQEAKKLEVPEIILTVDKYNEASKRVIEMNGGKLYDENNERWFFSFDAK